MFFKHTFYTDAARRVATSSEEPGESVLNRRIPKGRPRRKARRGQSFIGILSPSFVQIGFNHAIPFLEDRSDAACRVVLKPQAHGAMWGGGNAHGGGNGRHWDRNAIPANADCRGGVFATRRFPRPPSSHRLPAHPIGVPLPSLR